VITLTDEERRFLLTLLHSAAIAPGGPSGMLIESIMRKLEGVDKRVVVEIQKAG
jgi:hypothetical protein